MKKNNNGFTLVELIAVIVLIALLFVVAIPAAMKVGDNAKKKSFETKINLIKSAGELYGQRELKVLQTETNSFCKIEGDKITTSETQIDEAYYPCFKKTVGELLQKGMIDRDDYYNCSSGLIDVIYNPVTENTINQCNVYIYFKNNKPSAIYDINDDCEIPVSELCGVSPRTSKSLVLNTSTTTTTTTTTTTQPAVSCEYSVDQTWDYNYTGSEQKFTTPCTGVYKLEVWGAQGGNSGFGAAGGKGGYSYGNILLSNGTPLFIGVGGQGGYNGGGTGVSTSEYKGGNGGGATHIAQNAQNTGRGVLANYNSYRNEVLIVAGGGGGGYTNVSESISQNGGTGGGETGGIGGWKGKYCVAANQTSGYSFGKGEDHNPTYSAGGGGGYFGGKCNSDNGNLSGGSAGGGSGYIGGVTNGAMENGVRTGNGYARVTLVSLG